MTRTKPQGWTIAQFDQVAEVVTGSTPSTTVREYYDGPVPFVAPADLDRGLPIVQAKSSLTKLGAQQARLVPKGSILVCCIGATIGKVGIAGTEVATNQQINSLVFNPHKVDCNYGYYYCQTIRDLIRQNGTSTTLPILNKGRFSKFEIPLPPLSEQKRIADILDKADAICRKRQEADAECNDFLAAALQELFGDPVTNPKGWPEATLEDVAQLQSGVTKGRKLDEKETVEIPYMRVWNVQDGHLRLGDIKDITVLPSDIEKYRLKEGDLLLTEGGDPDQLGRGAIWYAPIPVCIHQNHIFRVRSNRKLVIPEFLTALIGSQRGKRYFLKMAKQTTGIASINMTQLKKCPVFLPPLDLQKKYAAIDRQFEATRASLAKRFDVTDDLFNSLVQRAFRGEL